MAYTAHRDGVAERFPDPAGPPSVAVALALRDFDDQRRRAVAWPLVPTAKQHDAQPLSRLPALPGLGKLWRCVLLSARHASTRFPRVQDAGSSGRWVQCAKASAGQREGTVGTTIGHASLTGACAEAALLGLRHPPAGHKSRVRIEKKPGQGTAWPLLAPQLARTVSDRLPREGVCALATCLQTAGRGGGEPAAALGHDGRSLTPGLCHDAARASTNAAEPLGPVPCPCAFAGTPPLALVQLVEGPMVAVGGPSPEPGPPWRIEIYRLSFA